MVFASAAARTTALTSVLAEGMVSYLQDTNAVEVYNGSAWVGVSGGGDVTEVQAGTGISVASGTGPIPVVTNTMATAVDAKGDLIVGTGADTFSRLAVGGTNGHTLQVDSSTSTGLKWAAAAAATPTLVGASVSFNSAFVPQTIANNTATKLNFAYEFFDTDGFHDNSTNNTRLTVPSGKGGYYFIRCNAEFASNATGTRIIDFYKNNVIIARSQTPGGSLSMQLNYVLNLVATDYMEVVVTQSSGGNLDIYQSTDSAAFTMYQIGV
jgi:hypothetical protein